MVLVGRERGTRMTLATVIPTKAATGDFAANRVVTFMKEIGMRARRHDNEGGPGASDRENDREDWRGQGG